MCRTPYRVSLVGGGADVPPWSHEHSGQVLNATINRYCWIQLRCLPPFFHPTKYHIVWSKVELCETVDQIEHRSVKACLKYLPVECGVEMLHAGDLPARSGMGSSSAFTVGMLHSLHALHGSMPTKRELAKQAIRVERDLLCENVGMQDQIAAAYGGVNRVMFEGDTFTVTPMTLGPRMREFESRLMLFYTGRQRISSDIQAAMDQEKGRRQLRILDTLVDEALQVLVGGRALDDFGEILNESWSAKCSLNPAATSDDIEAMRAKAATSGAMGSKLLGAGAGGFLLVFTGSDPDARDKLVAAMDGMIHVPFKFENHGSTIVHYEA